MHKHETQPVQLGGQTIEIDVKLAALIPLLWEHDVLTLESCQEQYPGLACIEFPGTDEVEEFLFIAQRNYKVELETWDEGEDGEHSIRVRLLVLFPMADIPDLVKRFTECPRD
jgi:hypothetical protein